MDIYKERIRPMFEVSGLTDQALEQDIGLPPHTIYKWNKRNLKSYKTYAGEIARYFHVSADYLLGLVDTKNGHFPPPEEQPAENDELSKEAERMIKLLRSVPENQKELAVDLVESVLLAVIRNTPVPAETRAVAPAVSSR